MTTRRQFLTAAAAPLLLAQAAKRPPNIVVLITDDQGYGDLSLHGNPQLRTPNLDRIGREGVQFTQFQVCPVCSPTRASLLTGRYNYRTGVVDTFLGRSMMHPDEVTVPELLRKAGYRTGIFGKWHLGDNYPLRAMDQGFDESLTLKGGGIGQPSDPPGSSYIDPLLFRNGVLSKQKGYCTDVFIDSAREFIERNRTQPFFAYVATNAPHTPLEVEDRWVDPFRRAGLDDTTAKVYGMVANFDAAAGRLLDTLRTTGVERDTLVVFLTDNGPQQRRYNAGMRGLKGSVYQGGIRVPFFVRWPAQLRPGKVDRIAAHIDLLPTLLEAARVSVPQTVDGRSLLPLLRNPAAPWPERTLFTQWHRGDAPEPFRNSAVRTQRWKLVDGKELYDLRADPSESNDLAAAQPEHVRQLRSEYERWFADVSSTRGYHPPRIAVGTPHENPVVLTRQDWRGPKAGWNPDSMGHWEVDIARAGSYDIALDMAPAPAHSRCTITVGNADATQPVTAGQTSCRFTSASLPKGPARVSARLFTETAEYGPTFVTLTRNDGQ